MKSYFSTSSTGWVWKALCRPISDISSASRNWQYAGVQNARRLRLIIIALCVLVVGAAVALAMLYPRATRSLVQPHQQQLVQRAEQEAAKAFNHSAEDQRSITFPVVMELGDRTCVELRSTASDRAGNYLACYSRSGQVLEERATIGF